MSLPPWILVSFVGFVFCVVFCLGFVSFLVAIKLSVFFDLLFLVAPLISSNLFVMMGGEAHKKKHFLKADNGNTNFVYGIN